MKDLFGNEIIEPEQTEEVEQKVKKLSPFDFLNSINFSKTDLIRDEYGINEEREKQYSSFLINRGLSYFVDTIEHSQNMNMYDSFLDPIMANDYYLNSVRKRKRFSKWAKKINNKTIETIMEFYQVSYQKAIDFSKILTKEQLKVIEETLNNGKKY